MEDKKPAAEGNRAETPQADSVSRGSYRFGEFRVERATGRLFQRDELCRVDKRVGPLLRLLIDRRPQIVGKDELFTELWPGSIVSDAALSRLISVTRKFLGDTGRQQRYIETVRGDGFRFVAEVETVDDDGAATSSDSLAARQAASAQRPPSRWRYPAWTAAVVAVVAIAVFALHEPGAGTADEKSVAVMPFINATGDDSQEYLGFGLAEELINTLVGNPAFIVAARTSSFALHERGATAQELGELLGVTYIVEGSFRRERDILRVTAQLIDTASGFHVWSNAFETSDNDIFALKQAIANRVAGEIGNGEPISAPPPHSPATYPLVLEGRYEIQRRTAASLRRGQELLLQAVTANPRDAQAQALLAHAYFLLPFFDASVNREDANRLAIPAAQAALDLEPDNPDALALMGIYATTSREYVSAFDYFDRGLSAHPAHRQLGQWHAEVLYMSGYISEARERLEQLLERDPLSPQLATVRGEIRVLSDDDVSDLAAVEEPYKHGIRPRALAIAAYRTGNADAFCGHYAAYIRVLNRNPQATAIMCDAARGIVSPDDAAQALLALPADRAATSDNFLREFGLLGQHRLALAAATKTLDSGQPISGIWLPELAATRQLPAFSELLIRSGLPELWQRRGAPDLCSLAADGRWHCR